MRLSVFLSFIVCSMFLTGCDGDNNFTPIKEGSTLEFGPECKMGGCSWTKVESINVSPLDKDTISVTVKNFYSSAEDENSKPKEWNDGGESKITCSKTKPDYDGTVLNINDNQPTSDAELSAVQEYFAVCHSFSGDIEEAKKKFHY